MENFSKFLANHLCGLSLVQDKYILSIKLVECYGEINHCSETPIDMVLHFEAKQMLSLDSSHVLWDISGRFLNQIFCGDKVEVVPGILKLTQESDGFREISLSHQNSINLKEFVSSQQEKVTKLVFSTVTKYLFKRNDAIVDNQGAKYSEHTVQNTTHISQVEDKDELDENNPEQNILYQDENLKSSVLNDKAKWILSGSHSAIEDDWDLSCCAVMPSAVFRNLLSRIKMQTRLAKLNMSHMLLTDSKADILCSSLQSLNSLKSLNISWNSLGDYFIQQISCLLALRSFQSLQEFKFNPNKNVTEAGVIILNQVKLFRDLKIL